METDRKLSRVSNLLFQSPSKKKHSSTTNLSKSEPHKKSVTKINILEDGESSVTQGVEQLVNPPSAATAPYQQPMNPVAKTKAKVNPIKKPERRKSLDVAAMLVKAEKEEIR